MVHTNASSLDTGWRACWIAHFIADPSTYATAMPPVNPMRAASHQKFHSMTTMRALLNGPPGHVSPTTSKLWPVLARHVDDTRPVEMKLVYRQRIGMDLRTLFYIVDKLLGKRA